MTGGRAVGDRVTARVGGARLVRAGGALARARLALAIGVPSTAVVDGVRPRRRGARHRLPDRAHGRQPTAAHRARRGDRVASLLGYLGFLAGPPVIGWVAEATTLRGGLGVGLVAALLVVALAGVLRAPRPSLP
jgi:hypothetical protein